MRGRLTVVYPTAHIRSRANVRQVKRIGGQPRNARTAGRSQHDYHWTDTVDRGTASRWKGEGEIHRRPCDRCAGNNHRRSLELHRFVRLDCCDRYADRLAGVDKALFRLRMVKGARHRDSCHNNLHRHHIHPSGDRLRCAHSLTAVSRRMSSD